jgi:hypothetical protein
VAGLEPAAAGTTTRASDLAQSSGEGPCDLAMVKEFVDKSFGYSSPPRSMASKQAHVVKHAFTVSSAAERLVERAAGDVAFTQLDRASVSALRKTS